MCRHMDADALRASGEETESERRQEGRYDKSHGPDIQLHATTAVSAGRSWHCHVDH